MISHQRRKRLYWTNIPDVDQPKDLQLSLDKYFDPYGHGPIMRSAQIVGRRINKDGKREDHNTDIPVKQYLEFRKADKVNTLTTVLKDNVLSLNDISNQEVNNNFQEIKVYRKIGRAHV